MAQNADAFAEFLASGWLRFDNHYCDWRGVYCDAQNRVSRLEFELARHPKLPGVISSQIGNFSELTSLHLDFHEGNEIHGSLPAQLGNCRKLKQLIVNGHGSLRGIIPSSFKQLTQLSLLHLDANQLSGTLPEFLSTLENLQELLLSNNSFTGTVPEYLLGLPRLHALELHDNPGLLGDVPHIDGDDYKRIEKVMSADEEDPESIANFINDLSGMDDL